MQTKKCSTCNKLLDITFFNKNSWNKDGLHHQCKNCKKESQLKYSRTKKGLIANIFKHQKETSKKRGYNPPSYSLKELREWCFSQAKFHKLFIKWKNNNYDKSLIPSVDRIDDYQSYTLDNIQLMSWNENHNKYSNDKLIGKTTKQTKHIKQIKNNKIINIYYSIHEAARRTNIHINNISSVLTKKTKTAGGFRWEYL